MDICDGKALAVDLANFQTLPPKQQLSLLFENQCKTLKKMDDLEVLIKGYKLHQKLQYATLGILLTLGTYLLALHLR